jgi:hypothetical protein
VLPPGADRAEQSFQLSDLELQVLSSMFELLDLLLGTAAVYLLVFDFLDQAASVFADEENLLLELVDLLAESAVLVLDECDLPFGCLREVVVHLLVLDQHLVLQEVLPEPLLLLLGFALELCQLPFELFLDLFELQLFRLAML